jgi:hypothetical protein
MSNTLSMCTDKISARSNNAITWQCATCKRGSGAKYPAFTRYAPSPFSPWLAFTSSGNREGSMTLLFQSLLRLQALHRVGQRCLYALVTNCC